MLGIVQRRLFFRPVIACARQKWTFPRTVSHPQLISPKSLQKPVFTLHSVRQSSSTYLNEMGPIRNKDGHEEEPGKVVDQMISENAVAIFSKSYCPFCTKVKDFFANKGIAFKSLELDLMGNQGADIQSVLLERTGQSTVPSVWVKEKFIGKILFLGFNPCLAGNAPVASFESSFAGLMYGPRSQNPIPVCY